MRTYILSCLGLVLCFVSGSAIADSPAFEGICSEVPDVRGHALQVDRHGNLWLWNRQSAEVRPLKDDFSHGVATKVPEARAVDVENDWGIAVLGAHGKTLIIQSIDTPVKKVISLLNEATDLIWIDAGTIAISTPKPTHLIEIWDIQDGDMVRTIGEGEPTLPLIGARFLRSLVLQYDSANQHIHALESVTGELHIFDLQGKPLRQSKVPAHRLPELQNWLRGVDEQVRKENRISTPLFTVLRLAVASDGTDAVLERCTEDRRRATLTRIQPDGEFERQEIVFKGPYCSTNFTLWENKVAFLAPDSGSNKGTAVLICTALRNKINLDGENS